MTNIKPFITRKINREYNAILLEGAEVGSDGQFKINATNAEKANDYLVKAMIDMSQEELDNLDQEEFEKILNDINKLRTKKKI